MQVGCTSNRADLAIAEGTGYRHLCEEFAAGVHIAIGLAVEPFAPPQASKQQGGQGFGLAPALQAEQLALLLA